LQRKRGWRAKPYRQTNFRILSECRSLICGAGMKALLVRDSAHCDDATTYFAAELWRDGRKVTFGGVFSP